MLVGITRRHFIDNWWDEMRMRREYGRDNYVRVMRAGLGIDRLHQDHIHSGHKDTSTERIHTTAHKQRANSNKEAIDSGRRVYS